MRIGEAQLLDSRPKLIPLFLLFVKFKSQWNFGLFNIYGLLFQGVGSKVTDHAQEGECLNPGESFYLVKWLIKFVYFFNNWCCTY